MSKIFKIKNIKKTKILSENIVEFAEHCPMDFILENSLYFKDLSTLVIGTNECTFYSRLIVKSTDKALHYAYMLDDRDIIFGCNDKIITCIKQMLNEGAKNIIILPTCIPNVAGLNIDECIEQIDIKDDENLFFLSIPHFKNLSTLDDISNYYDVIINNYKKTTIKKTNNIAFYAHNPKITCIDNVIQFDKIQNIKDLSNIKECKYHLVFSPIYVKAIQNFCNENDKIFVNMSCLNMNDIEQKYLDTLIKAEESLNIFYVEKNLKNENEVANKLSNKNIAIISNGADEIALYLESLGIYTKIICLNEINERKKINLKKIKNRDLQIALKEENFELDCDIVLKIDFSKIKEEICPIAKINRLNQMILEKI